MCIRLRIFTLRSPTVHFSVFLNALLVEDLKKQFHLYENSDWLCNRISFVLHIGQYKILPSILFVT